MPWQGSLYLQNLNELRPRDASPGRDAASHEMARDGRAKAHSRIRRSVTKHLGCCPSTGAADAAAKERRGTTVAAARLIALNGRRYGLAVVAGTVANHAHDAANSATRFDSTAAFNGMTNWCGGDSWASVPSVTNLLSAWTCAVIVNPISRELRATLVRSLCAPSGTVNGRVYCWPRILRLLE